jgi:1,4-dihydroxy-2-naphthoate octaprenyltransferase
MASVVQNWGEILRTQNLSSERSMDLVSRWLLITRASVFPMTLISGTIGGLLAASADDPHWGYFVVALLGILLAHAANNMINDYFDLEQGVDEESYVRGQYAPHPVLSGLISKQGLIIAIAVVNLFDLAILLSLYEVRGWPVLLFAMLGFFISFFYVAPPLRLKHRGLGEPGVFLVWAPLMIGGTYFVTAGSMPPWVLVASIPYGLLVTAVLMGKHVDKLEADQAKGIHSLPVLLGRERALFLTQELIVGFFAMVGILVLAGTLGVWTLLVLLALPRAWKVLRVLSQPPPAAPPPDYPLWPLWYVAWVFLVTRLAGAFFVAGLFLNAIWPVYLA